MHEVWAQWEGQIVGGRFPLRRYLGGTQQSAVFLTEYDRREARSAVIKLVAVDSGTAELLLFKWKLGENVAHPHLIHIFETGRGELGNIELFYVVMEYAEENLSQVLRQRALTPAEACDMLKPTVAALAYLHGKGLVHGHLKPANIMAVDDQLRVSSDGLYRSGARSDNPEEPSAYDFPEIAQGMSPAGDVWSLGVTLVEALTQHPRVQGQQEEPVLPSTVSGPIVDIAHGCLRRDPALRWTVADIATRLGEISAESVGHTTRAHEPISNRRYVTLAAILGAALVLGVVVAPRIVNRPRDAPPSSILVEQPSAQPELPRMPATPDLEKATKQRTSEEKRGFPERSPSVSRPPVKSPAVTSSPGEVVQQVLPDVPAKARDQIRGTVRVGVKIRVDPSGSVVEAKLDSAGPSKYFANLALQAARSWRFKAPRVDGRDASSEWLLRFAFSRAGTVVVPRQTDR